MNIFLKAVLLLSASGALIVSGTAILKKMHDHTEQYANAYAILYNCTKVGFTDNEPYYACDTGLVTRSKMAELAEQGDSNAQK